MRALVITLTIGVLIVIGYGLKATLQAGHWWVLPIWIAGCLWAGYLVGNDADKAEYKRIIARILAAVRR